jgi:hypothetical protein
MNAIQEISGQEYVDAYATKAKKSSDEDDN